jgi:hypothetical protein
VVVFAPPDRLSQFVFLLISEGTKDPRRNGGIRPCGVRRRYYGNPTRHATNAKKNEGVRHRSFVGGAAPVWDLTWPRWLPARRDSLEHPDGPAWPNQTTGWIEHSM